ncbi:MAG: hypothetical protein AB1758_22275, partial [Candidatus Eremiobacterota bacterium]
VPAAGSSGSPVFSYTINAGIEFPASAPLACFDKKDEWVYLPAAQMLAPTVSHGEKERVYHSTAVVHGDKLMDRLHQALGGSGPRPKGGEDLISAIKSSYKEGLERFNVRLVGLGTAQGETRTIQSIPETGMSGTRLLLAEDSIEMGRLGVSLRGMVDFLFLAGCCSGTRRGEAFRRDLQALADNLSTEIRFAQVASFNSPLGMPPDGWASQPIITTYRGAALMVVTGKPLAVESPRQ